MIFFIKKYRSNEILCILLTTLRLSIHKIAHQITVATTAPDNHRWNIVIKDTIDIRVTMSPMNNIFVLSLTLPVPARIAKLIVNNILIIRKGLEYLNNSHEWRNFCPKNIVAISGPKTKNKPPILRANIEKYL